MIATAVAVAFVVYSCKGKLAEAESINIKETPVQIVDDMFIVQSKNGKMQMRAQAPLMEKYERDSLKFELFPEGFFCMLYNMHPCYTGYYQGMPFFHYTSHAVIADTNHSQSLLPPRTRKTLISFQTPLV